MHRGEKGPTSLSHPHKIECVPPYILTYPPLPLPSGEGGKRERAPVSLRREISFPPIPFPGRCYPSTLHPPPLTSEGIAY